MLQPTPNRRDQSPAGVFLRELVQEAKDLGPEELSAADLYSLLRRALTYGMAIGEIKGVQWCRASLAAGVRS